MGLLNRRDAKIFRGYFNEMVKLIGQSVGYQYVVEKNLTIHSEDNSKLSTPIRIDILFDENPQVDTLNRLRLGIRNKWAETNSYKYAI